MAKLSKSEVKAAISKIRARKEPKAPLSPMRFPRSALRRRLEPVFREAGLDIKRLDEIVAEERKQLSEQQKKLEQQNEKWNSALAKQYEATLQNKKLALQAIAGETIGVGTVPVHTASAVDTVPDAVFASERRQPWDNWIKFYHHDSNNTDQYGKGISVKFFFAWLNPTNSTLIVHANADVIYGGKIQAIAQGGFISPGYVSIKLSSVIKAYPGLGSAIYGTYVPVLEMFADTYADILGGDGDWQYIDLYHERNLPLRHLLVKPRQVVIFEVSIDFRYHILNGIGEMEFTYLNRKVTCPALIIEYGGRPTDIASDE